MTAYFQLNKLAAGKFRLQLNAPLNHNVTQAALNFVRRSMMTIFPYWYLAEVKSDFIPYLFSSSEHLKEDAITIVNNLNKLCIDNPLKTSEIALTINGPAVVTGKTIEHLSAVKVFNDCHLFTIVSAVSVTLTFSLRKNSIDIIPASNPDAIQLQAQNNPIAAAVCTQSSLLITTHNDLNIAEQLKEMLKTCAAACSFFDKDVAVEPPVQLPAKHTDNQVRLSTILITDSRLSRCIELLQSQHNCTTLEQVAKFTESDILQLKTIGTKTVSKLINLLAEYNLTLSS